MLLPGSTSHQNMSVFLEISIWFVDFLAFSVQKNLAWPRILPLKNWFIIRDKTQSEFSELLVRSSAKNRNFHQTQLLILCNSRSKENRTPYTRLAVDKITRKLHIKKKKIPHNFIHPKHTLKERKTWIRRTKTQPRYFTISINLYSKNI